MSKINNVRIIIFFSTLIYSYFDQHCCWANENKMQHKMFFFFFVSEKWWTEHTTFSDNIFTVDNFVFMIISWQFAMSTLCRIKREKKINIESYIVGCKMSNRFRKILVQRRFYVIRVIFNLYIYSKNMRMKSFFKESNMQNDGNNIV